MNARPGLTEGAVLLVDLAGDLVDDLGGYVTRVFTAPARVNRNVVVYRKSSLATHAEAVAVLGHRH